MKRGGGLFAANPLTGSVGVVTINLPRLGYEASSEENFFQRLQHLMEIGKESSEIKRKVIERYTEKGLYPYSKYYLRHVRERHGCFWKNHFSTIGINGMETSRLMRKVLARQLAIVNQTAEADLISIEDYVLMGRLPHHAPLQLFENAEDYAIAERSMQLTGIWEKRKKMMNRLSGGGAYTREYRKNIRHDRDHPKKSALRQTVRVSRIGSRQKYLIYHNSSLFIVLIHFI